ncbi:helix-turn-helix domain-containing protein [Desulfobacter sp.]|uniref:helix-turn-helix domain-containing protein n=1 Tax=Desulfobacter sp. TaxID=2294 RepID=UPI003D1278A1
MAEITITVQYDDRQVEDIVSRISQVLAGFPVPTKENLAENELMTTDEAAAFLKATKKQLYQWTMRTGPGAIPKIKIGKHLRFRRSELEAWINEQRG